MKHTSHKHVTNTPTLYLSWHLDLTHCQSIWPVYLPFDEFELQLHIHSQNIHQKTLQWEALTVKKKRKTEVNLKIVKYMYNIPVRILNSQPNLEIIFYYQHAVIR